MSDLHHFTDSELSETENDAMQINECYAVTLSTVTRRDKLGHDKLTVIWRKASSLLASFGDELA